MTTTLNNPPARLLRVQDWAIWRLPKGAVAFVLVTACAAATSVVFSAMSSPAPSRVSWIYFAALLVAGILHNELSRSIEYTRKYFTDVAHVTMTIVWVFAGVLILPLALVLPLKAVMHVHLYIRSWSHLSTMRPHRVLFNISSVVVCAGLAQLILPGIPPPVALSNETYSWRFIVVVIFYFVATNGFVAVIIRLASGPRKPWHGFINGVDAGLDVAVLVLGFCAAFMLIFQPFMLPFLILVAILLHRGVLAKQMETLASTDGKTGLRNAVAWHEIANRELERSSRSANNFGVVMVDLDHFKKVNDTYGHLAGDEVLKAVADILKTEVRTYDTASRFGGEEFAVLTPDADIGRAVATAERIRQRVENLVVRATAKSGEPLIINSLTTSVGVAIYPQSGDSVERLLLTADNALYAAKNNGRNQVVAIDVTGSPLIESDVA